MVRKSISLRIRFEIFRRDGFRCVYCGATPDRDQLRVDHVSPVSADGTNQPSNLVTSCFECNAGKGASPLYTTQLPGVYERGFWLLVNVIAMHIRSGSGGAEMKHTLIPAVSSVMAEVDIDQSRYWDAGMSEGLNG